MSLAMCVTCLALAHSMRRLRSETLSCAFATSLGLSAPLGSSVQLSSATQLDLRLSVHSAAPLGVQGDPVLVPFAKQHWFCGHAIVEPPFDYLKTPYL